jgi:hypothetical protein
LFLLQASNPSGGGSKKVDPDKMDKKAKQFGHHDFGNGHTAGKHHVVKTKAESEYDHIGQDLLEAAKTHGKNHHKHHTESSSTSIPVAETKPAAVPKSTE